MNGVLTDYRGKRFGLLTAIEIVGRANKRAVWRCVCDCGNEKDVRSDHLKDGRIQSCGCLLNKRRSEAHTKHGKTKTRLYGVWLNMKNRCYNKNVRSYKNYGAQGVEVCNEWLNDFSAFSEWAYTSGYDPNAPYGKCTLERVNVYGNYCPENCTWVDAKAQANNRRKRSGADDTGATDR